MRSVCAFSQAAPALLARQHCLVVPVGALDEAHAERRAALLGEGQQPLGVFDRALQVRLHHHSEVRVALELGVERQLLEEVVGDVVVGPLLEVDVERDVLLLGAQGERQHALLERVDGALPIDRIDLAEHRRDLEADVGTRDGAQVISVDSWNLDHYG